MARVNNTCQECARKKQKCTREKPTCRGCIISKLACVYPENSTPKPYKKKTLSAREKELEERLNQLEAAFKAANSNSSWLLPFHYQPNESSHQVAVLEDSLSFDAEGELAENDALELLGRVSTMSVAVWIRAKENSTMLKYAVRGLGFDLQGNQHLPPICAQKAILHFSDAIGNPTVTNVRAILTSAILHIKLNRLKEGFAYYACAVRMAKEVGINKEETLAFLYHDEIEREECRKLWWWIYGIDQFLRFKNKSVLDDSDNGLFLPGNYNIPEQDKTSYLGISIMASKDWFTPPLVDQNIQSCRLLLTRIFGKVLHFNHLYHHEGSKINVIYILSTLACSLELWWTNLPGELKNHLNLLYSGMQISSQDTWRVFEMCTMYNFTRAEVLLPTLFNYILENKPAMATTRSFMQLTVVAKESATLLKMVLHANPSMILRIPLLVVFLFHLTIPIYCATLIDLPGNMKVELQESLDIHVQIVKHFLKTSKVKPLILDTFDYLISLKDVKKLIVDFTRFKILDQNPMAFQDRPSKADIEPLFPNQLELVQTPWTCESENTAIPDFEILFTHN
ncbi:Transcriptional activator [Boothiomyces sp. JEL0838]|nr:Transcriptional activator [Boothiomyces sp. JEL0838]